MVETAVRFANRLAQARQKRRFDRRGLTIIELSTLRSEAGRTGVEAQQNTAGELVVGGLRANVLGGRMHVTETALQRGALKQRSAARRVI